MAWGADVINSFGAGYERGTQMRERARKNKLAEILSQSYQQPQEEVPFQTDEEQLFGLPGLEGNVAQEATPGGFDYGNAIARMYKEGFGPEALQFGQQLEDRELSALLKRSQMLPKAPKSRRVLVGNEEVTQEFDPASGAWREVGRGKKAPLVNIDVSSKQEFSKKLAQEQAKIYGDTQKASTDAGDILSSLDQLESILPEVNTGMLAPVGTMVGAGIEAVGGRATKFGLADPAKAQQFEAVSNRLALGARQGMPGAMSDADRQFLINSVANLGKTPEANQEIINNFRMAAQRAQEKAVAQDQWIQQNGNLTGFNESWNKYVRENPLFQKSTKQYKLGSIIEKGGRKYRIIKLDPNGDHEVAPVR